MGEAKRAVEGAALPGDPCKVGSLARQIATKPGFRNCPRFDRSAGARTRTAEPKLPILHLPEGCLLLFRKDADAAVPALRAARSAGLHRHEYMVVTGIDRDTVGV